MKPLLLAPLSLALLFASCGPTTPEGRIDQSPAAFHSLTPQHQGLVRQGRIDTGMPPKAVRLAWGNPTREYEGSNGGASTHVWEYDGSEPVYSTGYFGNSGYGRFGGRAYAVEIAPSFIYVPYRKGTVWFRNGKVDRWEKVR